MILRYLVDTDWAIHYLNGRVDVVNRLRALRPDGLGLSVVTLAELYEGVYYSRDPEKDEQGLNNFSRGITVIGFDEETSKIFGRERGRLRQAGQIIGDIDLFIAATALQYNLILLSNNRRHFERIDSLRLESI
jgi:tRNA(fMet)-specific endonuclease VapC